MYYAFIENDKINGCGQCSVVNEEIQNIEITQEQFNNIQDYVYLNGEIILNPDLDSIRLNKAKEEKIKENDILRDEALNRGVLYKDVLFDSDTDQKVNLLAIVSSMNDEDTIVWYGKDNQPLECSKEDLINIGGLITQLHSFCWSKNALIKNEINNAQTTQEIQETEINYFESEGNNAD